MTLYGHFKTRGDLVDAALRSVLDESNELLKATDTRGDPQEALVRLVGASWPLVHRFGNILAAAHREVILGTRLMHAAAEDVAAGRLTADQVPGVLATTLLAAPSPAGSPAPARIG